ncbi:MAG: sigma-54-dependent transcriptional regulator, partial [Acidobacteriota bacterium]
RHVDTCDNGGDAVRLVGDNDYDVVLLDLVMPDIDGLKVIEAAKPLRPSTEFIVLTAMDDVSTAVKAIRLGAYDYLVKPAEHERLLLSINRAYERKALRAGVSGPTAKERAQAEDAFSSIVTRNMRMKELLAYAHIMARSGAPILITGESGTGKELLAQGFHSSGLNPEGPFIAVNVACVPESLFESEFFGYAKGAFTGAEKDHPGYFERADGGTLFLDEIGELPPRLQAKLLRVLEEKTVTRIGDTRSIQVSFRIVSATNRDLDAACRDGSFRFDLLYRLKAAHIHLPALKERRDDIPLLAGHFLKDYRALHHRDAQDFSPEAMEILMGREYPGNIRQLAQEVERAVLLCDSKLVLPKHLGEEHAPLTLSVRTLCTLKENDEIHLAYVLNFTRGDTRQAADILGVTVRQVQRKVMRMRQNPRWATVLDGLGKAGDAS